MSLLQDEDFVIYQLRAAYLSAIKDGVGERLINVDTSVLNNPAFRAAGWVPNTSDIKRTYSPPIPTAITSEYFQAPRSAGLKAPDGFGDDEEEGGMVTGGGSNDTVGPILNTKRRRRKELLQEDDSSDLSDDSEEENEGIQRPANQIKFTKMPLRGRAGSSPIQGSALRNEFLDEGPSVLVTSPSRPTDSRLRRGSLGAVETVKVRARRDTATSSEMSSENEMEAVAFQRKKVNPLRAAKASTLLSQRIQEDERERLEDLEEGHESDSSLSSEFSGTADSASLLGEVRGPLGSSPGLSGLPSTAFNTSPKKPKPSFTGFTGLQALPPPRPISVVPPISALTQALHAKEQPSNPLQRFATWNAKNELKFDPSVKTPGPPDQRMNPLYIKIYYPFCAKPSKATELLLKKTDDNNVPISVAEAIGFALWTYQEEKMEPSLSAEKMNVNCWVMRMYDDGEVDDEFPPLTRNKPLMDFASNNSRGMRPRARDKPWDEFALVEASEREFTENDKLTPVYSREAAAVLAQKSETDEPKLASKPAARVKSFRNPIIGPSFAPTATRKDSSALMDVPAVPTTHAAAKTGAPRTVTVHFVDEHFNTKHMSFPCTTDTYIAEIFDKACHGLGLDKGLYMFRVSQSATVAPTDRTVEALGERLNVDLVRKRFMSDGLFGIAGSPGSSSPNAPLIITSGGATKKGKKDRVAFPPLGPQRDALLGQTTYYRRYTVLRKQPMSFASSTTRTLVLDSDFIHIMPGETTSTKALFDGAQSKTTRVHFSNVVGSKVSKKHPKMLRVLVYKERDPKRYDFEAVSHEEAVEIVKEIKDGINRFQGEVVGVK